MFPWLCRQIIIKLPKEKFQELLGSRKIQQEKYLLGFSGLSVMLSDLGGAGGDSATVS